MNGEQRFCILCELCVHIVPFLTVFSKPWKNHLAMRKRLPDDNIDWSKYAGNLLKVNKIRCTYFDGIFLREYVWLTCCDLTFFRVTVL